MHNRSYSDTGRLLVVDDNKVNRLLLARGLEQQGHSIATAENGREALEMLRRSPYDLLLLDIEMPEMDGFQVLEVVLNDPDLRHIPVIVTSALEGMESVVRCIELGAEDYLPKPLNPILLRARVNASLEKKHLRDQQRELIRKFATSEVAEDLLVSGFSLGGKRVEATAMFSDIRSFTTITESLSPEAIIDLLNTYYTLMFEAIGNHSGIVNQMQGDGLMAIFGAPVPNADHARQAVLAALEMIELIELFNIDQKAQGNVQIRIGIGIAAGNMIAGYTGTSHRATYTCVGDTVNQAARLEAHTKVVGQPILIDGVVRQALGDDIQVQSVGEVVFKGKTQAVEVFSVPVGQKVR
jgi:class 3 adenylate cyclase